MRPVKIKYLGLIPLSRRAYLTALAVAGVVACGMLIVAAIADTLPPLPTLWEAPLWDSTQGPGFWLYANFYRIILVCLIGEALDAYFVLRRFAKKEAEAQVDAPGSNP
jgi:hypothetical protein